MSSLQPISGFSKDELKKVIDAIDYVFFDVDGVLVHNITVIPGSQEGVTKIRQLGKRVAFVTNNSTDPKSQIAQNLKPFNATEDEIVIPRDSLLVYLKKKDFKKDIYVIGCSLSKNQIRDAGYNIIEYKDICSQELGDDLNAVKELSLKTLEVCKNVGAVFLDMDMNICFGAIQCAKIILNHIKDVTFISGILDDTINLDKDMKTIASKCFIDGLERWTKRKSVTVGKPGFPLKDLLVSKFNISDNSRVLFIGDNVFTDISFGVNSGFKTCLLLSGVTSKNQVEEWSFPENLKPTYIAPSLGELYEKIKDL